MSTQEPSTSSSSHPQEAAAAAATSTLQSCLSALSKGPGSEKLKAVFEQLASVVEEEHVKLQQSKQKLEKDQEALQRELTTMQRKALGASPGDVIALNVGGEVMASSRATLCLVPGSLLAYMLSGRWEESLRRDEQGRIFLDFHPGLFRLVLNWLRCQALAGPGQPLSELGVPPGEQEDLMALVDYLQLQRHIPLRYTETWSPELHSPGMLVQDGSAWRGPGGKKGNYAVAATAHTFFDVHVEMLVEVIHFSACSQPPATPSQGGRGSAIGSPAQGQLQWAGRGHGQGAPGLMAHANHLDHSNHLNHLNHLNHHHLNGAGAAAPLQYHGGAAHPLAAGVAAAAAAAGGGGHGGHGGVPQPQAPQAAQLAENLPQFVGVMSRGQLEAFDMGRHDATWQSSCCGWWTRRGQAYKVVHGKGRKEGPQQALWQEGDSLLLRLDCRKHLEEARLSITNTRDDSLSVSMEIDVSGLGSEDEWVVVVGLTALEDKVRINSARRLGMKVERKA